MRLRVSHRKGSPVSQPNEDQPAAHVEPQDRVQWIYASESVGQLEERYDQWAAEYDADLLDDFGWLGPRQAVDVFARYVPADSRVLDAGAGTGLVGVELKRRGYGHIEALDLSAGMLEEARKKDAYTAFHQATLGEPLDFPDGAFDAAICVGVLTLGHAPARSLYELARVTRPGGCVAFTLRPDVYQNNGFREIQDELSSSGKWTLEETTEPLASMPKGEPDVLFQVWVYRVS